MTQKQKKFIQPRFWVTLSVILLIVFAFAFAVQFVRLRTQKQTLENLEYERMYLMEELSDMTRELEYMQTDEYIEQAARELGMLLPDEVRYVPAGQ